MPREGGPRRAGTLNGGRSGHARARTGTTSGGGSRQTSRRTGGGALLTALTLCGCAGMSGQHATAPAPVVNSAAAGSTLLGDYLQMLQRLVQGPPAEQAEIVASAQREYDNAPTPSRELKLALVLEHASVTPPPTCRRPEEAAARADGEPGDAAARGAGAGLSWSFRKLTRPFDARDGKSQAPG